MNELIDKIKALAAEASARKDRTPHLDAAIGGLHAAQHGLEIATEQLAAHDAAKARKKN
jgi:hypothetical protein